MLRAALLFLIATAAVAAPQETGPRFVALDVLIDVGREGLAAYQLELRCDVKVVGVEGGEPTVYSEAPYYDPAALQGGRIVIAAFTTDPHPPSGKVRVARLHLRETGSPEYAPKLIVAAAPGGGRIGAKIELVAAGGKR